MLLTMVIYLGCASLLLLLCVLLGLTVYYDAKAKHIEDATLWGVVAAISGPVGCLLYFLLVRRHSQPMRRCTVCGVVLPAGQTVCSRCNAIGESKTDSGEAALYRRRSKTLLISWLIAASMAVLTSLFFLIGILFSTGATEYADSFYKELVPGDSAPYEYKIDEDATWNDVSQYDIAG